MTWNDVEIYKLIQFIGGYIEYYIYDSDLAFSVKVKDQFGGKMVDEIKEKTRSLLSGLELSMGTKCFRNEVLHVDNQVVYVQELLYQVAVGLPENCTEDVWSPDLLSLYINKIQQYHHLFFESPQSFFRNTQVWGKSVTQCKAKFYALRDLQEQFHDDPHHSGDETPDAASNRGRKSVLRTIFSEVPTLRVDTSGTSTGKVYRQHSLWTTVQQSRLLNHLLKITEATMKQMDSTDIESLIEAMKTDLNRTAQACVNKLINMQSRLLTNDASAKYAQTLPDILYDRTSQIHHIFTTKDWINNSDPIISGIIAIKKFVSREIFDKHKKGKARTSEKKRQKRLSMKSEEDLLNTTTPPKPATEQEGKKQDSSEVYSDFVKAITKKYSWKEESSYRLCQAMYKALPLYEEGQLKSFFSAVSAEQTDFKLTELYFKGREIISLFEQDYGKLKKFGEIALHLPANNQEAPRNQVNYQPSTPSAKSPGKRVITSAVKSMCYENEVSGDENEKETSRVFSGKTLSGGKTACSQPIRAKKSPLSVASTRSSSKAQSIDDAGFDYDEYQDSPQVFENEDDEDDLNMLESESIQETNEAIENEDNFEEMESDNPSKLVIHYETNYRKRRLPEISHENTEADVDEETEEKWDETHDNIVSATVEKIRTPMPTTWKNLFGQLETRINDLKKRRNELVERAEERKKRKRQQENDLWTQALSLDVRQMPMSSNSTTTFAA